MSTATLSQIQTLYKSTLSASAKFASYNYRTHFLRRTDEIFKPFIARLDPSSSSPSSSSSSSSASPLTSSSSSTPSTSSIASTSRPTQAEIDAFYKEHSEELKVLQRAADVNRAFEGPKLVVEHPRIITSGGGAGAEASMAGTEKLEQGTN